MNARILAPLSVLALLAACNSDSEPVRLPPGSAAATATPPPDAPRVMPGAALVFSPQPGWTVEKPDPDKVNRKAQYRLPRAEGDVEDASIVVTYFGPSGAGSTEMNLQRWAGQFEQPDGGPSAGVMKHASRSVNGMSVLDVDISGTYLGSGMPGAEAAGKRPGWRMLASMIESDHGPYFVKLLGPEATVSKSEASYRSFIESVKPAK